MKTINTVYFFLLLIAGCGLTATTFKEGVPDKNMIIGTYGSPPQTKSGAVLYDSLINQLKDLHANTYNWLVMPNDTSYEQLKEFLPIAKRNSIDVWATLFAPAELEAMHKQYPSGDMRKWAADLAALSITYPNLKAWSIGDFVHNIKVYTPQHVSEFQSAAKKINPDFKFYPVCYYGSIGKNFAAAYASLIDGILFPYRNESVKTDLSDDSHVDDEINTIRGYMGNRLPIILFVYSSGHNLYGNPTPEYISNVIESGFQHADGIMIYRHPNPRWDADKYKAVKAAVAKGLEKK